MIQQSGKRKEKELYISESGSLILEKMTSEQMLKSCNSLLEEITDYCYYNIFSQKYSKVNIAQKINQISENFFNNYNYDSSIDFKFLLKNNIIHNMYLLKEI